MSGYEVARKCANDNQHIKNMIFHDEDYRSMMRQIQATYKVKQLHTPDQGYGFQIRLIWDHDRLFGDFELGFFKGVLLIDPGPGQDHFQAEDEFYHRYTEEEIESLDEDMLSDFESATGGQEYPLIWRGRSTETPDTPLYSTLTVGKIHFGKGKIWGHLDAMFGVGLPNACCEFHGEQQFGPGLVPISIQDAVDGWNFHSGPLNTDEIPRTSKTEMDKPDAMEDEPEDEDIEPASDSSPSTASDEAIEEDHEEFLSGVWGIFDITCEAIEGQWPRMSKGLTICFDCEDEAVIWGHFNVGIGDGFLKLSQQAGTLAPRIPFEFQWRGRESEPTGSPTNGDGEVTFLEDRTVTGVFRAMCGDIEFKGKRKLMQSSYSGRDTEYCRSRWAEYAQGSGSNFYSSGSNWY